MHGVRYPAAQGIVDSNRVFILGGSYGGYATLMRLTKDPDLYKCGIAETAVSDIFWLGELGYSDTNQIDSAGSETFLDEMVGDPKTDQAMMKKYSPRLHADQIKAPLIIVHNVPGVRDQRVPFKHVEGMRDAMRAAGKDVEWVVYPDEAHGFAKFENRVDRYNKIEAFLKKNIGQ